MILDMVNNVIFIPIINKDRFKYYKMNKNKTTYLCNICKYDANKTSIMRQHIIKVHGDVKCIRRDCNKKINVKNLRTHSIWHMKKDIENGIIKYGDWTSPCCLCGKRRDRDGFHYCVPLDVLYGGFTKKVEYKQPKNGIVSNFRSEKLKNPYIKVNKKEVNNKVTENGEFVRIMAENIDEIKEGEPLDVLMSKSYRDSNIKKLKKIKKHHFKPKLPARYDSDDTTDYDSD